MPGGNGQALVLILDKPIAQSKSYMSFVHNIDEYIKQEEIGLVSYNRCAQHFQRTDESGCIGRHCAFDGGNAYAAPPECHLIAEG